MQYPDDSNGADSDKLPYTGSHRCARQPYTIGQGLICRSSVPLQRSNERGIDRIEHDECPFIISMTASFSPRTPPPLAARSLQL